MSNPAPSRELVESWLTPERLARYVAVSSDDTAAVELYEWNIVVSGAFYEVLGMVEVLLRNAMHTQLVHWQLRRGRSCAWFDDPTTGLHQRSIDDVTKARGRLHVPATQGRIVAELPFGFWRYLLERRYQTTLWPQALRRGFPHLGAGGRRVLRDTVLDLQGLRNRIAHHEPIHGIDLSRRHRQSLDVAGYIDPAAARWVQRLSRVPSVLQRRPPSAPVGQG